MKNNSMRLLAVSAAAIASGIFLPARADNYADVVFVIDESGSMAAEHAWLASVIPDLEAGLLGAGYGSSTPNLYAVVGFGGTSVGYPGAYASGRDRVVTTPTFTGAVDAVADITGGGGLASVGAVEDGYEAIMTGLNLGFRAGSARNVILVTDEDRDVVSTDTYASVLSALDRNKALLNVVVSTAFADNLGGAAMGVSGSLGNLIAYTEAASGNYTPTAAGDGVIAGDVGSGAAFYDGTGSGAEIDYVDLALDSGGAAWDLNQLEAGGNTALSFSHAFVDIKVQEIIINNVPEGQTWLAMAPIAAFGVWAVRRRRQARA